jgi:quercetin dioxygenase-like cupin family protein
MTIPRNELGVWFKAFREQSGESVRTVAERVLAMPPKRRKHLAWLVDPKTKKLETVRRCLKNLEQSSLKKQESLRRRLEHGSADQAAVSAYLKQQQPLREVRHLAEAYSVSQMMLGPLLAEVVPDLLVRGRITEFKNHSLSQSGRDSTYAYPMQRIFGTNAVFVHLFIKPGGRSDIHAHPGNELILCIRGTIEFRLESNGVRTVLGQHDFVHFTSEQTHWVTNCSTKPAQVFIVRFIAPVEGGPLKALAAELSNFRSQLEKKQPRFSELREIFRRSIHPWFHQTIQVPPHTCGATGQIMDPVGLGRMLKRLCSSDELAKKAKQIGFRSRKAVWRFWRGELRGTSSASDVVTLARLIKMPLILFAHVLFPRVPNCVVVRQDEDLRPYPKAWLKPYWKGANYQFPCRNLADSDVVISFLNLPPRTSSLRNHHPGYELALPLGGQIQLLFPNQGRECTASAAKMEFLHYRSDLDHQIIHAGSRPAKVLIIRFLEYSNMWTSSRTTPMRRHVAQVVAA